MVEQNDFTIANEIVEKLKGKEKVNQEKILRWVNEELGLNTQIPSPIQLPTQFQYPATSEESLTNIGQKADIKTFYRSKNPGGDVQSATVIAYFYKFIASIEERKETINKEVLENATRQTGIKQFVKASQTLVNAKNQGYLDSVGGGEYTINSVGENLVVMTLGEGDKTHPIKKKSANLKNKSGSVKKGRK